MGETPLRVKAGLLGTRRREESVPGKRFYCNSGNDGSGRRVDAIVGDVEKVGWGATGDDALQYWSSSADLKYYWIWCNTYIKYNTTPMIPSYHAWATMPGRKLFRQAASEPNNIPIIEIVIAAKSPW